MARVLVIEDDPDIRDVLVAVLESEGYDATSAANGLSGLSEARRRHPDLILLDLMMPVMDGWVFRTEQVHDPSIAHIPVVVVSAFKDMKNIDAAEYIQKPCEIPALLDAVERHRLRAAAAPS